MFQRVGEVPVNRRDVATVNLGDPIERRSGALAGDVHVEVDPAARLEEIPELHVLWRGSLAQAVVVKLEILEVDVQVHGAFLGSVQGDDAAGAYDCVAVGSAGALDRDGALLDADVGREVVDRKGKLGAFPDAIAQPRHHIELEPAFGGACGVIAQAVHGEVDHAAVESQGLGNPAGTGRQLAAQAIRNHQARELSTELDDPGVQVDFSCKSDSLEAVSAGGAVEIEEGRSFEFGRDVETDLAQNGGAVVDDGAGRCQRPQCSGGLFRRERTGV